MNTDTIPINEATKALLASSSEVLLDAVVQLTHRIHATTIPERAEELRWQRAMVRAELLRRLREGSGQ